MNIFRRLFKSEPKPVDVDINFNFKLVIIEALLDKDCSFKDQIKEQRKKYDTLLDQKYDESEYEVYTEEAYKFFENIVLTEEDLDKVETLVFDGGLEVYQMIIPNWDGEDERFDIAAIDGIEKLLNLKEVNVISMINEELLKKMESLGISVV